MKINIDEQKEKIIINLSGELNASTEESYKEKVLQEIKKETFKPILVNMGNVTFVDSTGVGCLFSSKKAADKNKIDFVLYDLTDRVQEVFENVGLKKVFNIMTKQEIKKNYK